MKRTFVYLKPLAVFTATILLITFSSRLLLSFWKFDRIDSLHQFRQLIVNGLRIDISYLSQIILIPLVVLGITILIPAIQRVSQKIIQAWLVLFFIATVFIEATTPFLIQQFDIRPNRLFIEYLNSPTEVSSMLFHGFLTESITVIFMLVLAAILAITLFRKIPIIYPSKFFYKFKFLLAFFCLFIVVVILGRSGLQHRAINPSMVAISNDRLVNSLVLNSTYSVLYAIYQMTHESGISFPYGKLEHNEMVQRIRNDMDIDIHFIPGKIESLHTPTPVYNSPEKKNLVIVVEESLGANFIESLGGHPVTPNIERWRHKSWFFDRLYATGTRSARGLEAVTTGFLPTTSRAVLKLPKSQDGFFALASYLKQEGYRSTFVYGGESHFDNMGGFFLNNGFDQVIDEKDYDQYIFKGSWGVSDEDLFNKALSLLTDKKDSPLFTLIFSSSNHPPFEFPDNKIKLYGEKKKTAFNAAKYSDYALGKFLNDLEKKDILKNSIVLVVADHEDKVFGSTPVPYQKYHIPGFIIGDGVEPRIDKRLVSQIDLAPTLISLMGINHPNPMIGRDLNKNKHNFNGRAIMQFGNNQAYMSDDCIVYLQPQQKAKVDCFNDSKVPDEQLIEIAISHSQFAEYAYQNEIYKEGL
ncbi:MAG: LTA synthase family protein [Thiotrichaceae bacterium]|nr:LTA synthase family protein [Thiotrichaceae bacterium]